MIDVAKLATGDSWRVAGHTLRPLEMGHVALLNAVKASNPATPHEAALVIIICTRPWHEWRGVFASRWFGVRLAWLLLRLKAGDVGLVRGYLASNSELPVITTKPGRGNGDTGTPHLQHVRSVLISECGYDPEKVWGASYGQAMWDYLARMEYNGAVSIVDRDEVEAVKAEYKRRSDADMATKRN